MKGINVGILSAIVAAQLLPWIGVKGGPLHPEIFGPLLVALIFFASGLKVQADQFLASCRNVPVTFAVAAFHFAFSPAACFVAVFLTRSVQSTLGVTLLNEDILRGLLVLGCLPPPVSSAVIVTSVAGGNTALSIINSTVGSFAGIFLTPVLLISATGHTADLSATALSMKLGVTIVVPLLLGYVSKLSISHLFLRS